MPNSPSCSFRSVALSRYCFMSLSYVVIKSAYFSYILGSVKLMQASMFSSISLIEPSNVSCSSFRLCSYFIFFFSKSSSFLSRWSYTSVANFITVHLLNRSISLNSYIYPSRNSYICISASDLLFISVIWIGSSCINFFMSLKALISGGFLASSTIRFSLNVMTSFSCSLMRF